MSGADPGCWLDEIEPLEPRQSRRQVAAVLALLDPPARRVLDLGCGAGRVLVPLAAAGHDVTGVDRDAGRLDLCRQRLAEAGASAHLLARDFLEQWPGEGTPLDAVLCLGHTLLTIVDMSAVLDLLRRVAAALRPGGLFLADDSPQQLWPQLTEGNWQSGLSPDGRWQMVWHPSDAVFALREGDQVDPECWSLRPDERLLRLWTSGELDLLADLAGLSAGEARTREGLLIMRRPGP